LNSAKWRLLAAQEVATPGLMTLQAVRDGGRIVEFVWEFANAAAARLLCHRLTDLVGERLLDRLAGHRGCPAMFDQYRCAVENGSAKPTRQVPGVHGIEDTYRRGALRLRDGIAVMLINVSAVGRVQALQNEILRHALAQGRTSDRAPASWFTPLPSRTILGD
jgi:two-component system CheB/CheR fusion protein